MLSTIFFRNVIFTYHVSYTIYHPFPADWRAHEKHVTQLKELQTVRGLLSEREDSEGGKLHLWELGVGWKTFIRWCVWYLVHDWVYVCCAYKPMTMGRRALETPQNSLTFDMCRNSQWNYTCICPFLVFVTWSLSMSSRLEHLEYPMDLAKYPGWMLSLQSAKTYRMYIGWEEYPRVAFRSRTWIKNPNQACISKQLTCWLP